MYINHKKVHRYLVDIILLLVTTYFIIRKTTEFSGSGFIEYIFQPEVGGYIVYLLTFIVIYALLARLIFYSLDYFKKSETPNLGLPHYRCLLSINKEIEKHIKEVEDGKFSLKKIEESHSYEENIQIIHRNFSEHLIETLKKDKVKQNDLFFSIFHDHDFNINNKNIDLFKYLSHYDPTLHDTTTSELDISKPKYTKYAGRNAIKKKKVVICQNIDDKQYEIGSEERRKSIKHYIGIPLYVNGTVVGLLNVEFHNKKIFSSAEDLKEFYRKEIQAFTYLYEYQMHKKYFFKNLTRKRILE